jgi:heptosyltransferase II
MVIPAAYALHLEGFEIYWVCGKGVKPLLECYSWIHLIPADDKAILLGSLMQRVTEIAKLWRRIAFKRFDLCAILYYDIRYRFLALPVLAQHTLAFSRRSRKLSLLQGRHHTDEYTRVLLGREDGYAEQSTQPIRPDHLPESPLPQRIAPRRIAIVPGGVQHLIREQVLRRMPEQALRRWPVESFVALTNRLVDRGWEVVLLGGPEDAWVKPHFCDLEVTDCIGKLSLPEVISVCNSSDAVVTHDTGPLHLAGLSDTCLVGIFGPTDPATRVPRRPFTVGIWGGQGFACRPCYDGRDFAPCHFNGCMHQVTPELVLSELDRLLESRSCGMSICWETVFPNAKAPTKAF